MIAQVKKNIPPFGGSLCSPIMIFKPSASKTGCHFLIISKLSSVDPSLKTLISIFNFPLFWQQIERKQSGSQLLALYTGRMTDCQKIVQISKIQKTYRI